MEQPITKRPTTGSGGGECNAGWLALWTHSHCERLVYDQLMAKGFDAFLPMIKVWSRRAGACRLIRIPMFPGYLFVRHAMDRGSYIELLKTRKLTRILGERCDRPPVIADSEITALQRIVDADLPVLTYSYLHEGQRVRITHGPLANIEGILVRVKPDRGHLVLSVELLQRSVAVEVDCTQVVPVSVLVRQANVSSIFTDGRTCLR